MALTINQVRIERRKQVQVLRKKLRSVDSLLEVQERKLDSIIRRSQKIPETNDIVILQQQLSKMLTALSQYESELNKGFVE